MKFGCSMEMVELNMQEPNRNRRESKYFWDEIYTLVSAAGFEAVEIPYEPKWDFGGRSGIPLTRRSVEIKFGSVKKYLEFLKEKGIEQISGVHFDPSLFAGDNMDMYFGAFEHFASEAIGFAAEAGCETLTLTPMAPIGSVPALIQDEAAFLERTAQMIARLAEVARSGGVRLCVKNEYWTLLRGEKLLDFMQRLPESVYVGIDTANLRIAGCDPVDFIARCAGRIGSVQFTDTAFTDDVEAYKQPLPEFPAKRATQVFRDLGQGEIDFPAVLAALEKAGYTGRVVVNNRQTRDMCRGLLRARYYIDNSLVKE